jgi:transposase
VLLLPSSVRIFLAAEPVDLRRGVDGLAALVRAQGHDVYSGHLFCFGGRRRDRLKILVWDRGGFVLYYKRLEAGRFRWPAVSKDASEIAVDATQLAMMLDGIDVRQVRRPQAWSPACRKLDTAAAISDQA